MTQTTELVKLESLTAVEVFSNPASTLAAQKKAEQDLLDAQLKADQQLEVAIQAERDRVAEKQRVEDVANAKREADKKHRANVEAEAAIDLENTLVKYSIDEELCRLIVGQIARGVIRNLKVVY